jgi:hypothetical protein
MEIKKFIMIGGSIEPKQLSGCDLLDLYRRTSRKSIKTVNLTNLNGKVYKLPKPQETLPQFCERLNIIKNPAYEPGINRTR